MVATLDISCSKPLATPASSRGIATAMVAVSGRTVIVLLGAATAATQYLLRLRQQFLLRLPPRRRLLSRSSRNTERKLRDSTDQARLPATVTARSPGCRAIRLGDRVASASHRSCQQIFRNAPTSSFLKITTSLSRNTAGSRRRPARSSFARRFKEMATHAAVLRRNSISTGHFYSRGSRARPVPRPRLTPKPARPRQRKSPKRWGRLRLGLTHAASVTAVLEHDPKSGRAGFSKRSCSSKRLKRPSIHLEAIALYIFRQTPAASVTQTPHSPQLKVRKSRVSPVDGVTRARCIERPQFRQAGRK
jgi:hypothetical protein